MLRKVAVAAASKPHVEIRQDGDRFYIKTSTTVRTTEINFKVGEGFEEETVDGRKCRVSSARAARTPRPPRFAARGARTPAGRVHRRFADLGAAGSPGLGEGKSPNALPLRPQSGP